MLPLPSYMLETCMREQSQIAKLPSLSCALDPGSSYVRLSEPVWKGAYLSFPQQVWLLQISLTSLH